IAGHLGPQPPPPKNFSGEIFRRTPKTLLPHRSTRSTTPLATTRRHPPPTTTAAPSPCHHHGHDSIAAAIINTTTSTPPPRHCHPRHYPFYSTNTRHHHLHRVTTNDKPHQDYIHGPEEPEQAPPSPNYILGPEHVDDEIVTEDQPYAEDALPIAQSPEYVPESDFKAHPEDDDDEDPKEDPVDYPADGGDDGDDEEESSEDDEDDDMDV
nr:hypothetical protein [Tanacetum cinerariifolium]